MKNDHSSSGNALWFILLAIVLLGALTIMLSRSSSVSDEAGDVERRQITVDEIMRSAKGIEFAVRNLQGRGCSENQISFENAFVGGYSNPSAPTDGSCHIFRPEGAGLTYKPANASLWLDTADSAKAIYGQWHLAGHTAVQGIGGDSVPELVLSLPYVRRDLCIQINKSLNLTNPSDLPPVQGNAFQVAQYLLLPFVGTFTLATSIDSTGNGVLTGVSAACTTGADGDDIYYHVIIPR